MRLVTVRRQRAQVILELLLMCREEYLEPEPNTEHHRRRRSVASTTLLSDALPPA